MNSFRSLRAYCGNCKHDLTYRILDCAEQAIGIKGETFCFPCFRFLCMSDSTIKAAAYAAVA